MSDERRVTSVMEALGFVQDLFRGTLAKAIATMSLATFVLYWFVWRRRRRRKPTGKKSTPEETERKAE